MSIIAHTRLTLLSQRCMSIVASRYDARTDGYGYFSNQHPNDRVFDQRKNILSIGYIGLTSVRHLNQLSCCNTVEPKYHSSYYSNNTCRSYKIYRTEFLPQVHKIHKDGRYHYNNYGDNFRESFPDRNPFLAMICILGLFKKAEPSDIEGEKEKLSNEEKVKKMKPAELLVAKGVLSMCDQEYHKAGELFHQALHIAQDEKNEEQETLVLNLLASNYFESGDFKKAEKLFIDLITRLIDHDVEPTNPAILELSLKLASIYSKNNDTHEKALKGFKFVINSLLSNLEDMLSNLDEIELQELSEDKKSELALLGWSYDWFAKHLIIANDYDGAAEMLQRAVKISSKILGPLHDQTLILLSDVGTTLAMNNSPGSGELFIKQAVEGAIKSQSRELASFYVNLGLVNLQLKKLSEAQRYCENSIELAMKNREHHNSNEVIMLSKNCLSEVERLIAMESH